MGWYTAVRIHSTVQKRRLHVTRPPKSCLHFTYCTTAVLCNVTLIERDKISWLLSSYHMQDTIASLISTVDMLLPIAGFDVPTHPPHLTSSMCPDWAASCTSMYVFCQMFPIPSTQPDHARQIFIYLFICTTKPINAALQSAFVPLFHRKDFNTPLSPSCGASQAHVPGRRNYDCSVSTDMKRRKIGETSPDTPHYCRSLWILDMYYGTAHLQVVSWAPSRRWRLMCTRA